MDTAISIVVQHAALFVFLAVLTSAVFIGALALVVKNRYRLRVTWRDGGIHMDPPK
jgi:hypothetical protein